MHKNSKIFVAGHRGLVGSAIVSLLKKKGFNKIILKTRKQLDLTKQTEVNKFFKRYKPEIVIIAAAKVGGIYANSKFPATFIYENLMIQTNVIHGAYKAKIRNLIFLGSSCIYPKLSKQPIKESYLLSGKLEETNEAYAIAKIAGIKMCENYNLQYKTNYKCLMPTNTFGPNDNYNDFNTHFIASLIKKIREIEKKNKNLIKIWGDGTPKREIIYVDDIADACIFFMKKKIRETLINIGSGKDYTIKEYAEKILKLIIPNKKIIIKYDKSKPNGTQRKILDVTLAKGYGWKSKTKLEKGIIDTYKSFLNIQDEKF